MGNNKSRRTGKDVPTPTEVPTLPKNQPPFDQNMMIDSLENFPTAALEGSLLKTIPSDLFPVISAYSRSAYQGIGTIKRDPSFYTHRFGSVLIPALPKNPSKIRQNRYGDIILLLGPRGDYLCVYTSDGTKKQQKLLLPECAGLAVEPSTANIYVSQSRDSKILCYDPRANHLVLEFEFPSRSRAWIDLCFNREEHLVSFDIPEGPFPRIMVWTPKGQLLQTVNLSHQALFPCSFCACLKTGNYICVVSATTWKPDPEDGIMTGHSTPYLQIISPEGKLVSEPAPPAGSDMDMCLTVDQEGTIICMCLYGGQAIFLNHQGKLLFSVGGLPSTRSVTLNKEGQLLICDADRNRIVVLGKW